MISLRQHIFSLIAVFVALAIGIAAGSTVVRGPLLESTRARLSSAEQQIDEERAENDALAGEVAQLDDWADDGPAQLLAGRLEGSAVLLVVVGDTDGDVVRGTVASLRASSAELMGEIRLDRGVFDPEQTERVAAALGIDPATGDGVTGDSVTAEGVTAEGVTGAFGDLLAGLIEQISTEVANDGPADGVLRSAFGDLEDAGLVDLLQVSPDPIESDSLDVVILSDRNLVNDPDPLLDALVTTSFAQGASPVMMVAEVGRVLDANDSPVASFVGSIRSDGRLRDEVSTVDNAETMLGWIALVLGLDAAHRGVIGHYGFREGADRAIPSRES